MKYRENHYVPIWYQERFLPTEGERKFRYLDLAPERFRDPRGLTHTKTALEPIQKLVESDESVVIP